MNAHPLDRWLAHAERALRADGMTGRRAYAAICRHLARALKLPADLWLDGPDIPGRVVLPPAPLTPDVDLFGLAYERFFPEVFKAEHGQFFTPEPIARLVVALTRIAHGDRVLDPTCGAGTFLTLAAEQGAQVHGIEVDPELVALCRLNLALHRQAPDRVQRADLFRLALPTDGTYDVILANPPFSVPITDPETLSRYQLAQGRARVQSDILFLEAAHARLRPGGRLGVVLPWSMVSNAGFAGIRDWLQAHFVRRAVVGLPEGVFRPFGGAAGRAAVLVLERRPAPERAWIAAMVTDLGYDPRRQRLVRTTPDGLADLTTAAQRGTAPTAPADTPEWSPAALANGPAHALERTTIPLGTLAPVERRSLRCRPDEPLTEVDLADIDKNTGEVTSARTREGVSVRGTKAELFRGDLVIARMRPSLNNVALVNLPSNDLPERIFGSSEWVRLVPRSHPYFVLTAARSDFVRTRLADTGGQTRPRTTVDAIATAPVPLPPTGCVELIDRIVGDAHRARAQARRRMDQASAAYGAWGRGELDDAELHAQLVAIARDTDASELPHDGSETL